MKTISQKKSVYLGTLLFSFFVFSSCDEVKPEVVNEDELITTVIITLNSDSQSVLLKSTDLDGNGLSNPEIEVIGGPFTKSTVYTGEVTFLNESVDPSESISDEVIAEAEEHQVFYQAPVAFGTFAYTDKDVNNKPVGLAFTFTTGANATTGNLTVSLRHEPNKSNIGVSDGNIANAGGSTDIEVIFPIQIQ